jgi:ligand-binding sensor domain-containing protein/serine phosphatase RsbU (regulator of sigma subunit)
MNLPFSRKTFIITLLCFLAFHETVTAQKFSFKNYSAEYGIPDEFIYTINQSDNGFLWVGTGKGIARFDGYEYERIQFPDSIDTRNITSSVKDRNGTIWVGCNDGAVFRLKDNRLTKLLIDNNRSISQIITGPDSMVYIIPQGKAIYGVNPENITEVHQYFISGDPTMYSACFIADGKLLVGVSGKILVCDVVQDSLKVQDEIDGFDYSGVTAITKTSGSDTYIIGTDYYGLFRLQVKDERYITGRFNDHPDWSSLNVSSVFVDPEDRIWVSTMGAGVIRFGIAPDGKVTSEIHYDVSTGLVSNDVKLVFCDSEGNYWFGLFSNGLYMLASNAVSYFTPGNKPEENNILFASIQGENYFLGTPTGFHLFDPVKGKSLYFREMTGKLGGAHIQCYYIDDQNRLWIGTDGKGLFTGSIDGSVKPFFRSGDSGTDKINDIEIDNNNIWLGTTNGVVVLGRRNGKLKRVLSMDDGLSFNNINKIFLDNGSVYLGTESQTFDIIDKYFIDRDFVDEDIKISKGNCVMSGSTRNIITGIAKNTKGELWAATNGNGIFICRGDSVLTFNRTNGLFSNFCYSIFADSRENIWIGHAKGFSRFDPRTEIIRTFDASYSGGGKCNPDAFFETPDGKVLIGTDQGVIVYDSRQDLVKSLPPVNNINSIIINDERYDYRPVIELPYKRYRVTINYSGINFSDPEKVYYSTYLENYEEEFSEMKSDRKVTYNLNDGKYTFYLISVDENGISQEPPVSLTIKIARPIYKKWWFFVLVISLITGIVMIIIRERDKAQTKIRLYLEDELEKRTRVIMQQKAEIELQNFEIKDSINYAKRIQSNILPDIGKLKDNFKDAFILFHPRDIVSGDFYWFDKVDDQRFILVCADSTGHGVPGGFMSMIGSTLLQDIVLRKKVTKPSQILTMLDEQIFSTLNQNVDLGVSNDGMDMVVCELNMHTRHLRFSSAMRPIIIVISGESNYIKGNRSSVGGESVIDKYFIDQEYYLSEGDTIYLFSDGLPDQFGGTDGKKMKIARLKKVIEQISKLPMSEQEKAVSDFFDEWKGDYEQVDDILLIGIRV